MTLDVFHDDNGVVHHETDRKHNREQREQIQSEPKELHEKNAADERHRDRHDRDQHRAEGTEEKENHDDDDEQRVDERFGYVVDGLADVFRGIVADARRETGRQILLDLLQFGAGALDNIDRVRIRQRKDVHEHGGLAGISHLSIVIFGAKLDIGDIFEMDDGIILLPDDETLEFRDRMEVGIGGEIDLDQRPFGAANRGEYVVGRERLANLQRTDVQGGHLVGFEPDPHRKGPRPEDVRPLHTLQGGKSRLHHPGQIVGNLRLGEDGRGKTQIRGGELRVGGFDADRRHLGFGAAVRSGPD